MSDLSFSALSAVTSFVKVWFKTLFGITVKKISHENTRIANHGAGFNCGISLEAVGGRQSLA